MIVCDGEAERSVQRAPLQSLSPSTYSMPVRTPRSAMESQPGDGERAAETQAVEVGVHGDHVDLADGLAGSLLSAGAPSSSRTRPAVRRARAAGSRRGRTTARPRAGAASRRPSHPVRRARGTRRCSPRSHAASSLTDHERSQRQIVRLGVVDDSASSGSGTRIWCSARPARKSESTAARRVGRRIGVGAPTSAPCRHRGAPRRRSRRGPAMARSARGVVAGHAGMRRRARATTRRSCARAAHDPTSCRVRPSCAVPARQRRAAPSASTRSSHS